jgi:hypothetical protein
MNKGAILILGIAALILVSFSVGTAQKSGLSTKGEVTLVPADKIESVKPLAVTGEKDFCTLSYTDWIPPYWYDKEWENGDKVAIYFDPADCGHPENYPFQLTGVHFELFDFAGATFAYMRFSVEVVCPEICDGPGIEIWKSRSYDIETVPGEITPVDIEFEDIICLDKPFFFNVEYIDGVPGENPSLLCDHQMIDRCHQWLWFGQPSWIDWQVYYYPPDDPPRGWVMLELHGFCGEEQTDCGLWYWKPDTTEAPSGMPDFDQSQFGPPDSQAMCGPTAVANCLWWFDAVPAAIDDPDDLIRLLSDYFNTDPASGTDVNDIQLGLDTYFEDYGFALYEMTYWEPDFHEMEDSLKNSQDIILLLGFWWWDEETGTWFREGGHYVTMAGVNSEKKEIAISDPNRDRCVQYEWWPGRVRPTEHPVWGDYEPDLHNDPTYVSHDTYISLLFPEFPSPGSELWELADYCYEAGKYSYLNVPERFQAVTKPAPKHLESWRTEVEAAIMICPERENRPPQIIQPDTLEGYKVCDTVIYTFDGVDPDGDPILDDASLVIEPPCGTYSVTRITGHGTSTGTWEVTWETIGCQDSIYYQIIVDLTDGEDTSWCTTYCHLDPNNPPEITQPTFLEGYVDDIVQYDITGSDPDGDVILNEASIDIQPDCGNYSITRTSGHGTSSGTWQITWNTDGCTVCDTHLVIHGLTDGCDTSYCTTYVHLSENPWYWKPPHEDYAPNGMPDIDQMQDNWMKTLGELNILEEQWTFCGPCAVANCFKWFDSKYNVPPGTPGDGFDQFPLVRDYLDNNPPHTGFDDHDPWNVDHVATGWNPGIGPPPPTPQPFVPGPQAPGQVPSWGELVERLAWYFDTDGIRTEYCRHVGTNIDTMQAGIDAWLRSETFSDGSTLADSLCETTTKMPTFTYVESLVEKCEDVILLLGFWYQDPSSGEWFRVGGHYVTVAGVNSQDSMIAFSDPFVDAAEMGFPGRVGDGDLIPHQHGDHDPTVHNDEGNVSHDIYIIADSPSPGGLWGLPEYAIYQDPYYWAWNFFNQNVPDEFVDVTAPWNETSPIYTEVEYCVHISPWDYVGDANDDGTVNYADMVYIVNWLFIGGAPPVSMIEADANCDGTVNLADAVFIGDWLFLHGPIPRCCDP